MIMSLTALTKCYCDLRKKVQDISASQTTTPVIATETVPVYEYRDIWAEESGGANTNSAEWSYGNGATGFMGLPIDDGWEIEAMYYHADTFPSQGRIQVDLMNYGNTPSNAAANTITSISVNGATDGGGAVNNAYKYSKLAAAVPIPAAGGVTTIGFITRVVSGNISDHRVGARLRRKVADVVTSATIA